MIEEGYRSKAKDWGNYTVKKVARLRQRVECYSKDKGKTIFNRFNFYELECLSFLYGLIPLESTEGN